MFQLKRFAKLIFSLQLMVMGASCSHTSERVVPPTEPAPEHYRAAGTGDMVTLEKVSDLQIRGSNINGTTLLMVAARRNRLNSADYLLSRGAAANAMDIDRQTVLHYALPVKNKLLDAALLAGGADPSVEDKFGVVPAVSWAEEGALETLLLALQNKDKWCCFAAVKSELQNILSAASKGRKYIPPTLFLILKELE